MNTNKLFPDVMPEFTIEKINEKPFNVKFEEVAGFFIIPKVGEKTSFAFYDDPDKKFSGMHMLTCIREAEIHGIPCVQVEMDYDTTEEISTNFIRMTETHISYVAQMYKKDNIFYFGSFYDDEFLSRLGAGENNIGREIDQRAKGVAVLNDDGTFTVSKEKYPDIFGRYKIQIGLHAYDTVAVIELVDGRMSIQYVDQKGRTVLFRRYNRFDWKLDRYKALWTEKLPNSEVLLINGEKYVHWYDCISDYVLK